MSKKQKKNLIRIIVSAALLVCLMIADKLADGVNGYIKLGLFLAVYLLIGCDVLSSAARNIIRGQVFDENFLMTIATVGAMFTGEYPEGVAVMLFYQVGEWFQKYAVGKSRKSITELMDIRPDYANVIRDGAVVTVSPEEVEPGETISIAPGEKIPLDCVITQGSTTVNCSALTGESLPRSATVGEELISGSINLSGLVRAEVKCEFAQSTVSKILDMVENSAAKKAKSEAFITRFARYYTPAVVASAVLLAVIAPLFFNGVWSEWIHRALIFLVVSCPCALVISVPLSFFGGIGGASRHGILVKGANYLEALSKVSTVVFDKTGTLTKGVFYVTAVHPEKISDKDLLKFAAYAESYSKHPIAESIKREYGKEIDANRIKAIEELPGMGVKAELGEVTIHVGNTKLMDSIGSDWHECHHNGTVGHIAVNGEYMGHIAISDVVKEDSEACVKAIKKLGVEKTVILTGDSQKVANAVGKELAIDEVYSQLMPGDKVEIVERLLNEKNKNSSLVFVGDGINDAPVISRADVGMAMGALGSDAAIESADIVLMDDKPSKLATAIRISKKTMGIVRQNIVFALAVKALVLILGALGIAGMWLAVFADVGVSVIAILNAMRAMKIKNADL